MNAVIFNPEELRQLIAGAVKDGISLIINNKSLHDPDEILTLAQAAKKLSLSEQTIMKWVKRGDLKKAYPDVRVNKFTRRELDRFAQSYRH